MANEKVRKAVEMGMTPSQALAQWVQRKVLHHDPLAALESRSSQKFSNIEVRPGKLRIEYNDGDETVVYNGTTGDSYRITVEKVA